MINLLKLARLQFLVAGFALFVFGGLVAALLGSSFSWARLLLGCLIVLSAQLSVNFGNDYFDVVSDSPEGVTFISGGSGILLKHPELRTTVKWMITALILFSLVISIVFQQVYSFSLWIWVFAVLGNLLGWMYSAPPFRLSQRGLGELCFTLVTGFLVPAMGYFTVRGILDSAGLFLLFPVICYILVFIFSVEIPDVEDDRRANKRTWVARFGRRTGFVAIGLLLLAATGYFFLLHGIKNSLPVDFRPIAALSLLPLLPGLWGLIRQPEDRHLATQIATLVVITLAIFLIAIDVYLFMLVISPPPP